MLDHLRDFNDLTQPMQRELNQRIIAANGDVTSVRRELEAALEGISRQQSQPAASSSLQADRALIMIELRYLDAKARASAAEVATRRGFLVGLRAPLKRWLGRGPAKQGVKS